MTDLLPRLTLTAVGLGLAGYLGFRMYSQPPATYRQIEPIRWFLREALARDTEAMVSRAGAEQPIDWALAARSLDSVAVYEWAESRPRVTSSRRGDTLWVTLRRPGSTKRCSPLYPLSAGFVEKQGELRLIHLSSSCPSLSRTKTERF